MHTKDKLKREKKIVAGLTILLSASIIASFSSTMAWYQYAVRTGLNYHGTAIGENEMLEIGVYSSVELSEAKRYGFEQDTNNPLLYWSHGAIESTALNYFLSNNGSATNELSPCTSGSYKTNDAFSLKRQPIRGDNYHPTDYAKKSNYVSLPLAFKVKDKGSGDLLNDKSIYLSNIRLNGTGLISNSLRFHIKSETANFILNPNSDISNYDVVGGPLDLDLDGYLDYDFYTRKELVYGEASEIVYNSYKNDYVEALPKEERTTFNGKGAEDCYSLKRSECTFKTSSYLGIEEIINNKMVLASTSNEEMIAKLDLTIYIEGWSEYVTDNEERNFFDLSLMFELLEN